MGVHFGRPVRELPRTWSGAESVNGHPNDPGRTMRVTNPRRVRPMMNILSYEVSTERGQGQGPPASRHVPASRVSIGHGRPGSRRACSPVRTHCSASATQQRRSGQV